MVEFDQEKHAYTVDGIPVPSVTELVKIFGEDMDEPDEQMEIALDCAAERGTVMHAYVAHRLQGGEPEDFELPTQYTEYADAVELFLAEHEIAPLLVETPLEGDGYAGTPDLIAEFDGAVAVLDYKFVSAVAKTKVAAQLAGYSCAAEKAQLFPERLYAVQFKRGEYRLYPVDMEAAQEYFLAALGVYRMRTKTHPRGRIG